MRRAAGSWAVGWALLGVVFALVAAVQVGHAEGSPGTNLSEWLERAGTDRPLAHTDAAPPGLRLKPTTVDLVEGGEAAVYEVVLRRRPSAPVFVSVSPDGQTAVDVEVLRFEPDDWDQPQAVSVWAKDDSVIEGPHDSIIKHYAASTDPTYSGLEPEELVARIEDNDTTEIRARPTSLTVAEPSGSAVFTLTLVSPPEASVAVPLVASNGECTVSPQSVILDQENWENGAQATVTASDDLVEDGEQICVIEGGPSSSSDPAYDGLAPDNVTVTVLDNERTWRALLPKVSQEWPPLPGIPMLQAIDNADGDGSYTIQWGAPVRAQSYVLQEATNPSFASPSERYAGPTTVYEVNGQGAARLFYRVKALNDWGESTWSGTQKVDVLWEAEPNDEAPGQANGPLASGLVYFGTFPTGQDEKDYYYFDLGQQGAVSLWLSNIPGGHNFDLVLRDDALETRPGWYSASLGNQDELVEATVPAGRYYIQVYNASGLGSSQPYHLQVQY